MNKIILLFKKNFVVEIQNNTIKFHIPIYLNDILLV